MRRRGLAGYAVLGCCLVLLGTLGGEYEFPTLEPGLLIVATGLVLIALRRRSIRLHLIDLWIFAFLYLFLSDLVLSEDQVLRMFGGPIMSAAEAFIVASFGASLIGYWSIERRSTMRRALRSRSGALSPAAPPPQARRRARKVPNALAVFVVGLSAIVIGYVLFVVTPQQLFSMARSERGFVPGTGTVRVLFVSALVMQPIVTTYLAYRYNARSPVMLFSFCIALLSAIALYAGGTRFYLGFMVCGIVFYVLQPMRPMSGRRAVAFLLAGLLCVGLQGLMRMSRRAALVEADVGTLLSGLWQPEGYLSNEGLLRVNAWVHAKRAWDMPARSYENLFILYWWVPRSVWEAKPTMEGHWLIQDVMDEGHFTEQHSVAGGFAMPALLDFGPIAGTVACAFYGAWVAWIERFCRRHTEIADPASVLVGLSMFGVFFMLRSPHTSLIFMMLCVVWYVPFRMLERRSVRARPTRLPRRLIAHGPAAAMT
jgi:oligosaccharide repeat unit polymerase